MAIFQHRVIFSLWVLLANLLPPMALAQKNSFPEQYKTALHLWQNDSLQTTLRPRFFLNGRWQAVSKKPLFSGEVEIPGTFAFEGEVEFNRSFRLDSTFFNRPLRLVVQGANYSTQIKINNELIGSHQGGYTPFVLDLRPEQLFFDKENLLELEVSNVLSPLLTLPPRQRPWGWLNEGGLGREIYLEALPEVFVEKNKFNYTLTSESAAINVEAEFRSQKKLSTEEAAGLMAVLEIWDTARTKKLATSVPLPLNGSERLQQALALNCQLNQPALWSPATPNLYVLHLALLRHSQVIDEIWEHVGFRKIELVDRQVRVNGQPYVLRGVNWIEDYGRNSALLDTTNLIKLLADVKSLGANAIRVVGHPPHPLLPKLCDRAGIFLLEDLPLYYLTAAHIQQPQFFELALLQARELITRDAMRPSVLGWGLAVNSDIHLPEVRAILKNFIEALKPFDDRPLYAVAPPTWSRDWESLVGLLLPDLFEAEHLDDFRAVYNSARIPVLPMIGFWVRQDKDTPNAALAEQRQAEKLNEIFKKFDDTPQLAGYFVQALRDWPAAMPALALGPEAGRVALASNEARVPAQTFFVHPAGLIGHHGQRRMAFQLVQAYNRGDRRPMMIPPSAAQVFPQEYPLVGLGVVLVLLFYLNRDRRLRANLQRMFVHPHGFYVDLNENRKMPSFLSALLGIAEGGIMAILLSGFCYANRTNLVFDQLLNLFIADPSWKARLIWLIWHPAWFILVAVGALFVLGLLAALFLRILGFFLGRSLPLIQYVTFVFWTATNLLILGILAPFFYRLLLYKNLTVPLLLIVGVFLLWFVGRFFRGLRVVYTMSIPRTIIIFTVLVGGSLVWLALHYQRTEAIYEYGQYYWRWLMAGR